MTLSNAERRELAREAARVAREQQEFESLTYEQLSLLDADELIAYLELMGVDVDVEALEARTAQSLGQPTLLALDRGNLDEPAIAAAEERARKALVTVAKDVARDSMRSLERRALEEADPRPARERYGVWIGVGDGCPSCTADGGRHGVVDSMDSWAGDMPGDGGTLCGKNCRCKIVPCKAPRELEGVRIDDV